MINIRSNTDWILTLDARKNKAYVYDGEILGAVELEEVDTIVKKVCLCRKQVLQEKIPVDKNDAKMDIVLTD